MTTNSRIKLNLDSLKSRREWKRHKVKDGHNVFRILPPFGESSNGYAFRKWQVIWGLKDPETQRARPYASSMTSEKKCPVTEYVELLKKKSETLKSQLQAAGVSEESIKERLKDLNQLVSDLKPKTVYVYNAIDKAGEVGLLEIKSTAHKKIKAEMLQYVADYNQDPTSLNSEDNDSGLWFDIIRQGQFRDTEYDVKKMQIKIKNPNGGISFADDRSPIPDSVVENYENLAYDLSAVYQIKTYDELKEILEVNLADIIELYPDADLNEQLSLELQSKVATNVKTVPAPAVSNKTTGAKPVTLKLDEEEEEEEVVVQPLKKSKITTGVTVQKTTAPQQASGVEDWASEYDAILKG